jgi:putative colanic acid biosynthesis acetyltransferase WcaF
MKIGPYVNRLSIANKFARLLWLIVYTFLFRPFAGPLFNRWRIFLLRVFGTQIGEGCIIYSSVQVWAPWNLSVGDYVIIGPQAICYNPDKIVIEDKVVISQYAHLCSASHDYTKIDFPLITAPIHIRRFAWVATDAFVGMGVTIEEGCVVGARSSVFRDTPEWCVVAGNPARKIKERPAFPLD